MENSEFNYTIALLIDADNISPAYMDQLMKQLNSFGRITIKRMYGDFSLGEKGNKKTWNSTAVNYGIKAIQQYQYNPGKNNADSALIIDAMDILHSPHGIDAFCIATSDSDFTPLSMRLKEDGMFVIGAGEEKTPNSLITTCDRFITLKADTAKKAKAKAEEAPATVGSIPTKEEIQKAISDIIANRQESADEYVKFSTVCNDLYKSYPQFDPSQYKINGKTKTSKQEFCASLGFSFIKDDKGAWVINNPN